MATMTEAQQAAAIVRDAGGRIVGRTRLQKTAYLMEAAGVGGGFRFKYNRFGPYSDGLADATRLAVLYDVMTETEMPASWGGQYSVFETRLPEDPQIPRVRRQLAQEAARAGAIELELAATAVFLAREGAVDPWAETARRKPDKAADGRLAGAQTLYARLRQVPVPQELPALD